MPRSIFSLPVMAAMLLLSSPLIAADVPDAAASSVMSVQQFLNKAKHLKEKGPFALLSPDFDLLSHVGEAADDAWKAQLKHSPKPACPPSTDISIKDKDFMAFMHAIPKEDRDHISVNEAYIQGMNKRYPCNESSSHS
ncbi:uncharacterized protein ZMO1_ZMO1660 [Zymomonas mobilis subsp. mobilis ZM4 = ATCC 31821]|uniref:Rap1a immunity protein domain-containing protein n=2 Tax=Zymomonas mobilis subsp. mobilis TaxID=120045 RepID=Q5NLX6_ZYMMO|nr:hypothetical protein [Zymomonas mobilis]AAV90284.1 conserved hypothetical protein [Zymomonas mobilis subsp. mobilis ZM4 = ATCC 31821]ACV76095.1 hypothetical protein Za10_1557 [Zymomonas mobilis subsp. mobilis NCIMB 11163]AEH63298.1 conserved hypothetical protein [Zymomonas mobilis subsp. mobilis ATCC 10988]AFN57320.1 hypothetical protein ZZ6_1455 [Zymomonas mobilis subsp. mobilis ATCC 29191]AHB10781.1 hypothetical protein ZCP4_1500 [Zymomonas mobilis subsp. mobilis str. CP4 = NRRL B-14023]